MNFVQRKRIRKPLTDYRAGGAYFCTVCVHPMWRRKEVFARVRGGVLLLNQFGDIVENCWEQVPDHRELVTLDAFVMMPNHVHLLFLLDAPQQTADFVAKFGPPVADSMGTIVGAFKSAVKRDIGTLRGEPTVVWQPRFYDRIVRDEREFEAIQRYIENNPANWINDRCHPHHPDFELAWRGHSPDPESFL